MSTEQEREYGRKWRADHLKEKQEYDRKRYSKYREEKSEYHRQWYAAHSEKAKKRSKKWVAEHPEIKKENDRKWRTEHPEKRRAMRATRRAHKINTEGSYTDKDILRMMKAQRERCYYCDKDISKSYHVEHTVPLSRGGANEKSNLVLSCSHCNTSKGAKLPHEWFEGGRLL